jgi:hypothetical protein
LPGLEDPRAIVQKGKVKTMVKPEKKMNTGISEIPEKELGVLLETRQKLRTLIYSGILQKPMGNTYWEELVCVGYNPESSMLEAVVSIKRENGYGGGICSDAGREYVRFFVDWHNDGVFVDIGVTSIKVADISDAPPGPQHPLKYLVTYPLDIGAHRRCCDKPVLPRIRAVLSFNAAPSTNPAQLPYFGNRLDASIQIAPKLPSIKCLMEQGVVVKKTDLLSQLDLEAALPVIAQGDTPLLEMAESCMKEGVPAHRFMYPALKGLKGPASGIMIPDMALLKKKGIDLEKVFSELAGKNADITYEELVCAGLSTPNDTLGAVIHIKKPGGYSGTLCKRGSIEYVAFWADWDNNGTFDNYLGTTHVHVHDIASIPRDGLYYGVVLPVNLSKHLSTCKRPTVVRIRAVLSWGAQPSTTDPDHLNFWGNRRDVVVQVRPGTTGDDMRALINTIGGVGRDLISQDVLNPDALGLADAGHAIPASPGHGVFQRPFGGSVLIQGRIDNTGLADSVYFRVQYKPHALADDDANWLPACHSMTFKMVGMSTGTSTYTYLTDNSPDGWFAYHEEMSHSPFSIYESDSKLAWWYTGSLEGLFDIRMQYVKGDPHLPANAALIEKTATTVVCLDNTPFVVSPQVNATSFDPAATLDIFIDAMDCPSVVKGTTITGHLRVSHAHFGSWHLDLQPQGHIKPPASQNYADPAYPAHAPAPGGNAFRVYHSTTDSGDMDMTWSLDTANLDPCGYTLTVWGYDRTIVNSNGAIVHDGRKAVGLCVRKAS